MSTDPPASAGRDRRVRIPSLPRPRIVGSLAALAAIIVVTTASASPPAPRRIDGAAAAADVELLGRALRELHAGYGRYTSATAHEALVAELARDAAAGMTDDDLLGRVSRVLASLRCDHTKAECSDEMEARRRAHPTAIPLAWRLFDGRLFVDRVLLSDDVVASLPIERGDEILAIEGVPVGRLLAEVTPMLSSDGWNDASTSPELEFSSELLGDAINHFWPTLRPVPERWTIRTRASDGVPRTVELQAITMDAWFDRITEGRGRWLDFRDAVRWRIVEDRVGYLAIDTFVNYRRPVAPAEILDPIFTAFADAEVDHVVLDLRRCGGGSTDVPETLATFLLDELPASAARRPWIRTRSVGDLRPHVSTWDESVLDLPESMVEPLGNGFLELRRPIRPAGAAPPRANRWRGPLTILTSAANSSGATNFIATTRAHRPRTRTIGAPTNGSAEGCTAGVILFVELPASGIRVRVPAVRTWNPIDAPAAGRGVVPDVDVRETREDWLAGRDRALEHALEHALRSRPERPVDDAPRRRPTR